MNYTKLQEAIRELEENNRNKESTKKYIQIMKELKIEILK